MPEEICNLKNLETLELQYNRLNHLPRNLGKLESLRFLNLNTNVLRELPQSLAELTSLVELNVANAGGLLIIPDMRHCQLLERLYIDQTTQFSVSFNPRTISHLQIIVQP